MVEILSKYKIIRRIGGTSKRKFGEIYLAVNQENDEQVILKTIQKSKASQVVIDRLKNESLFTFELEGLPTRAELIETSESYYLIRDYRLGCTIDEYWGELKKKEQIQFIVELFEGLLPIFQHLEINGIVHADIKPSNIIITNDVPFKVHMIDFGLAIRTDNPEVRRMIFPLGYAAPELILNHLNIVSSKTDQYALGVTLWRLFTGKMPLIHPNPSIFTNLQLTHPIPEHSKISKEMFQIIERMTFKHQFKIPPNKMTREEVEIDLKNAMNKRYDKLSDVIRALKEVPNKRSFYHTISFR